MSKPVLWQCRYEHNGEMCLQTNLYKIQEHGVSDGEGGLRLCPGDWRGLFLEATHENQKAISDWADATFGPVGSNARVAARANEEMAELLRALTADNETPKAKEEIADIVIVLFRLAERLGSDLLEEVDRKMAVNRAREWKKDGSGHGYHVRRRDE